jgi:hypothetical protein
MCKIGQIAGIVQQKRESRISASKRSAERFYVIRAADAAMPAKMTMSATANGSMYLNLRSN